MTREEFMQEYILSRTSHKKKIEELIADAEFAWDAIHKQ